MNHSLVEKANVHFITTGQNGLIAQEHVEQEISPETDYVHQVIPQTVDHSVHQWSTKDVQLMHAQLGNFGHSGIHAQLVVELD